MTDQSEQTNELNVASKDEKMWAMFCHLSALAVFIVPFFGNVIGPLVIWIIKKEEFPLVDDQGKESLNFQISMSIYFVIAAFLIIVALGIVILPILGIFWLIMIIMAAIKANDGEKYRYPFTIRLVN